MGDDRSQKNHRYQQQHREPTTTRPDLASVHDEGSVLHDRFVSGLPAHQDEVSGGVERLHQHAGAPLPQAKEQGNRQTADRFFFFFLMRTDNKQSAGRWLFPHACVNLGPISGKMPQISVP